ncbi:hypothetical protein FZEAL_1022 [Fusarium zealandicum]|uniref:chitinase n=1 Tax=Fusarium zealandicum TaxID=1053134 RepID=A0A8H4UTT5_9HYPO|nr:hypothetical protein FZEAL_1022 [Fusarium zealandicum]
MPSLNSLSASLVGLLSLGGAGVSATHPLVASTYFAGFHSDEGFPVGAMQWDMFTDAKYAFAETTQDGRLDISGSDADQIPAFVQGAKLNGVKALVSIGGWTGSRYFSTSVGDSKNRTAFVETCVRFAKDHNLDGLDFDWEWPNRQGLGCSEINENDTANFLKFLQELRQHPEGKNLYLTAAGSLFAWNDKSGVASKDLKGFADVLEYIMIMNYDLFGAWTPTAGPNAPLSRSCDERNVQGAADDGVEQWTAAGIPASQLVLGVPTYGRAFSVNRTAAFGDDNVLNLYPAHNATDRRQGSRWDNDPAIDVCGVAQPFGFTYPLWSMILDAGFLDHDGNPAPGMAYAWDNCSKTPAVYDPVREIYVNYDNTASFYEKGKYIVSKGLRGFGSYEAGGDYNNILTNAMHVGLGL